MSDDEPTHPGNLPLPNRGPLGPGRSIGPYVIQRELGRGGMGAVFVAHHTALGRDVALKVVIDPTPRLHERFLREARGAAKLSHPGIVTVHDVGQDDGLPYLAMDLVDGEGLDRRLAREGRLAPAEAARLVSAMADAVAHAHAHGVLHRDLKPANVLVTPDGRPLLTDFGLAKDLQDEDRRSLTTSGELLGTPGYMAPEQADGQAKRADARADVYGLGATLYAALTGRPPFVAGTVLELITQVCRDRPRPPSAHAPGIPPALDALVLRTLEKEPEDRIASARELCRELERFRSAKTSSSRSRPPWLVLVLVLVAALVGATVVVRLLTSTPPPPAAPAPDAPAPVAPIVTASTPTPAPPAPALQVPDALDAWTWVEVTPEQSPPKRLGAERAMVHVPRKGVVLVAGWGGPFEGPMNDVWSWNGEAWTIEGACELHRYMHSVAWNDARAKLVFFGGSERDKVARDADLWTWGGEAWERPPIEGERPSARQGHVMAYAPDRERVLMFGGKLENGRESDELWEWDGERWRLAPRGAPHPPARMGPGVAYDTTRDVLVVYGGALSNGRHVGDLWEWNGTSWKEGAADPGRRIPGGMVFDGRRTILFGGTTPAGRRHASRDDTWSWDGETWRELAPPKRPPARHRSAMAWDPARRVVVLHGGTPGEGATLQDTWELRPVVR